MLRRLVPFAALMLLASAPQGAPLRHELERALGRAGRAELDCLLRAPENGVRWVWDGTFCVGLVVGRLSDGE